MIGKEAAKGMPKELHYPIGYARRQLTPEARKFLEQQKRHPVVAGWGKELSTKTSAQIRRRKTLGAMTDDEVTALWRKYGFKGKDVFEPGMAGPTFTRAGMSARSVGAGDTIDAALTKFARKAGTMEKYTFPADEVAKQAGLNPETIAKFQGKMIPRDVADALLGMQKLATSEEAFSSFWKSWTAAQRYMKGAFTMPWPAIKLCT